MLHDIDLFRCQVGEQRENERIWASHTSFLVKECEPKVNRYNNTSTKNLRIPDEKTKKLEKQTIPPEQIQNEQHQAIPGELDECRGCYR